MKNRIEAKNNIIKVFNERGSIQIKRINSWLGEIEKFFIEEKYRRNGIGSSLLKDAELKAKEMGYKKLSLLCREDNEVALYFYLANRYITEGWLKSHFEDGKDIVVMSKFIQKERRNHSIGHLIRHLNKNIKK